MKGKVYKSCVRLAMLYESETWCLREKEMATLKRTERAMIRAMCGVTQLDRRNSKDLMDMLGIKESLDRMTKASIVVSAGHFRKPVRKSASPQIADLGFRFAGLQTDFLLQTFADLR